MTGLKALIKHDKPAPKEKETVATKKQNALAGLKIKTTDLKFAKGPVKPVADKAEGVETVKPPQLTANEIPSAAILTDDDKFIHPDQPDAFEEEQVKKIKDALSILKQSLTEPELVAEAIKNILSHLKQHEFLKDILADEDLGLMVEGLRKSYGVVIAKKTERKTKTSASAANVDEAMAMLADMEINI